MILPSWIRIRIPNPDPIRNNEKKNSSVLGIRITLMRFRIQIFFYLMRMRNRIQIITSLRILIWIFNLMRIQIWIFI